jgi:hypothetical protein
MIQHQPVRSAFSPTARATLMKSRTPKEDSLLGLKP